MYIQIIIPDIGINKNFPNFKFHVQQYQVNYWVSIHTYNLQKPAQRDYKIFQNDMSLTYLTTG